VELATAFGIDAITFRFRYQASPELALTVVLWRLSWPSKWARATEVFGRSQAWLSVIFTDTIDHLANRYGAIVEWHPRLRSYRRLRRFAQAVSNAGAEGPIWGFVDGHFQGFARPGKHQRKQYSGHKKAHGCKYSAIVTPDGIVSSLVGPFNGSENDWFMFQRSGVIRRLRRLFTNRRQLFLYGDPAYYSSFGVIAPFKHRLGRRHLTMEQRRFNKHLSSFRISVEHAFGDTTRKWTYTTFAKQLVLAKQAVGQFFIVAVLLTNCYTCMNGSNQTSEKYGIRPPTLYEYLCQEPPQSDVEEDDK
jgi:hypothetical protein